MSAVFPTVREVLALDPVRRGAPRLVAGAAGLDRPVRWVHVAEVPDIATLLGGGELVLTTGIGCPPTTPGCAPSSATSPTSGSPACWSSWAAGTPARCPG